jgi:hypothetical protein
VLRAVALSPKQLKHNRRIAREGGYARVAAAGRQESTAPMRAAFLRRFELAADPDGTLPPTERRWRAEMLLKKHMACLARKSAARRSGRA